MRRRTQSLLLAGALLVTSGFRSLHGQAQPAASGPGSYVAVGGAFSGYYNPYGQRDLAGSTFYADVNPTWRYGFEGEMRSLKLNQDENVTLKNYFVGVRVSAFPGRISPFGKFMVGAGRINFPFLYAKGTFFTYAPGAGVDIRVNDLITVRTLDFEYQMWQDFPYGNFHPYGLSTGITIRLSPLSRIPRHAYYSRSR